MKLFFILITLFIHLSSEQSIYNISLEQSDGTIIQMKAFINKKILITAFNPNDSIAARFQFLDSLQQADTSLQVIAVPSNDFGGSATSTDLNNLITSLHPSFIITKLTTVKKSGDQHPLFAWLTDVSLNGHFNLDVIEPDQVYLISKTGVLYSVLNKEVPPDVFNQILHRDQ